MPIDQVLHNFIGNAETLKLPYDLWFGHTDSDRDRTRGCYCSEASNASILPTMYPSRSIPS